LEFNEFPYTSICSDNPRHLDNSLASLPFQLSARTTCNPNLNRSDLSLLNRSNNRQIAVEVKLVTIIQSKLSELAQVRLTLFKG